MSNNYYSLELPVSECFDSELIMVESSSPFCEKEALETLALYFKREFHYDFPAYKALSHTEPRSEHRCFLFTEVARDLFEEEKPTLYRAIGGCGFRREEYTNYLGEWLLCWVWLHPFLRHRGVLSKHWKRFENEFGAFRIQEPISPDMQRFLQSNQHK